VAGAEAVSLARLESVFAVGSVSAGRRAWHGLDHAESSKLDFGHL
jgi:hypothetical protein